MGDILEMLAAHALERVEEKKRLCPLAELKARVRDAASQAGTGGIQPGTAGTQAGAGGIQPGTAGTQAGAGGIQPGTARAQPDAGENGPGMGGAAGFPFEQALSGPGIHFICECKKASPSKGLIAPDFPYVEIARAYEAAGASAISVLTEPKWFLGEDRFLQEIAAAVRIPCLRKDFTVDPYMIYEAKILGASAVLLICAILEDGALREYLDLAHELGLSALVETHDADEIGRALDAGARIIGVNNRDLRTFQVDIRNSVRLRSLVPADRIFVSESGIRTPQDVAELYRNGTNAVLIGETLMRSPDKKAQLDELRSGKLFFRGDL